MPFVISKNKGCSNECCFNGVIMDADTFYEGFDRDLIYPPCECNPKHCKACEGTGELETGLGVEDCEHCGGTGWLGQPEHPDERYSTSHSKGEAQ